MSAHAPGGEPKRTRQALKIDIVVHGRFHAFSLANGLRLLGHDVLVHTNYPKMIAARFGLPADCVRSFVAHGVLSRAVDRVGGASLRGAAAPLLHTAFGTWAARGIRRDADIVHGFTGVMEEALRLPRTPTRQLRTLVRGSVHIREQARLLLEEEQRAGTAIDRPNDWMIAREEREYALADRSFTARGIAEERLLLNPLGVDVARFRADEAVALQRQARIMSGAPLRVLNVGTFSFQKGILDFITVAETLKDRMRFRFVGGRPGEAPDIEHRAMQCIEFVDRVPESALAVEYAWGDVFMFQTIQDGFAAVLAQAAAAGLPILATPNCAAPDFVEDGRTGWIRPIRDAGAFIERLNWCDQNRAELAAVAQTARTGSHTRPWADTAAELAMLSVAAT